MVERGKYIYGITDSNTKKSPSPFGSRLVSKDVEGTAGEVVFYTIPYQDISAVVSDSEIVDYTRIPKDAVARLLVGHQRVIERIMNLGYAVIPMRLGTFAVDETEVKEILKRGYGAIKDIVEKIRDHIEIDVVATWSDLASVLKEIGEEKEIKEFKERLFSQPRGITLNDQMKVGVMVKGRLDQKREKHACRILEALKTLSQDFDVHEQMDDTMVTNTAFLISQEKQDDFDRKIEDLNNECAERLNFRCVGPLPPYSFYTLEIKRMKFEGIDWAKKKLGLHEFITKEEIKKAYHRSALSSHPDKNPGQAGMEEQFDDLTKAYKILVDYCASSEQAGQGDRCSLNAGESKKDTILLRFA